jgi:hypothetical protein
MIILLYAEARMLRGFLLLIFLFSVTATADLKNSFNGNNYNLKVKIGKLHSLREVVPEISYILFSKGVPYFSKDSILNSGDLKGTGDLFLKQGAASYFSFKFDKNKLTYIIDIPISVYSDHNSKSIKFSGVGKLSVFKRDQVGSMLIYTDLSPVFSSSADVSNIMGAQAVSDEKGIDRNKLTRYISVDPNAWITNEKGMKSDTKSIIVFMQSFYKKDQTIHLIREKGTNKKVFNAVNEALVIAGYKKLEILDENK